MSFVKSRSLPSIGIRKIEVNVRKVRESIRKINKSVQKMEIYKYSDYSVYFIEEKHGLTYKKRKDFKPEADLKKREEFLKNLKRRLEASPESVV